MEDRKRGVFMMKNPYTKKKPGYFRCELRKIRKNPELYLLLVLPLAIVVIFKLTPLYWLKIAFLQYNPFKGISGSKYVGLAQFERIFTDMEALRAMRNTLIISLYRFVVLFPAPIILALMLNEVRSMGYKRTIQTIVYLPHFLSWVVAGSILITLLSYNGGLINELFRKWNITPVNFLSDKTKFRTILVVSAAWKDVGWNSILYLAAITGIDPMLYEAAEIDGAGRMRKIWSITLPGIADTIVVLMLIRIGSMMASNMDQVLMLYNPLVYETGDVIDTYVFRQGISKMEYSFSTAVGLFNSVVGFLLLVISNAISRKVADRSIW